MTTDSATGHPEADAAARRHFSSRDLQPTRRERAGQPIGYGVSFAGHLLLLAGVLVGGQLFYGRNVASLPVADVQLVSVSEFGGLLSSAPVIDPTETPEPTPSEPVAIAQPEPEARAPAEVTQDTAGEAPTISPPPPPPPSRPEIVTEATDVAAASQLVPPTPAAEPQDVTPDASLPPDAPVVPEAGDLPVPEQPQVVDESTSVDTPVANAPATPVVAPTAPPPPRPQVSAPQIPSDDDLAQLINAVASLDAASGGSQRRFAVSGAGLSRNDYEYLRRQIKPCWNLVQVSGARRAQELQVTLAVHLTADGHLRDAPQLVEPRFLTGGAYQSAFAAARSAVERCQPYSKLPRDSYDRWRNLELTFDPKGMVAR